MVRRVSLANSNSLSDTDKLAEFLAFFPNLNELDIRYKPEMTCAETGNDFLI